MRKHYIFLVIIVLIFSFSGCSKIEKIDPNDKAPVKVKNYPVIVDNVEFTEAPKTVVSLSPALTEILFEIGVGEKVIGRSDYCDYPESVSAIPSVGSPAKPDIDKILEIKPELLVTKSPIAEIDANKLKQNGIKVLNIPAPKTFFELVDNYARLSLVFLGNNNADKMTTEKIASLDSALFKAQENNYAQSFVFIMTKELAVATGDTLPGNMLSVFGSNVAKDYKKFTMPVADIVKANPSVVFVSKDVDVSTLPKELAELPAIKNGKTIAIDYKLFERPTSRITAVIEDINTKLSATAAVTQTEDVSQAEDSSSDATQ